MMKTRLYSLFLLPMLTTSIWLMGQNDTLPPELVEATQHMNKLTSDEFAGRGYTKNGHEKAAAYIASQFEARGLIPMNGESYLQKFYIEINLPEAASLTVNGKPLVIGKDFIVNKFSGSGQIDGKIIDMGYGLHPSVKVEGKIVVIRDGWPTKIANDSEKQAQYQNLKRMPQRIGAMLPYQPLAIVILQKKLTAGFTREQAQIPILEVNLSAWPRCARKGSLSVVSNPKRILSQNVVGYIPGTAENDTAVIISAHYDHLGQVGTAIFAGANDNASGVSMMLTMFKPMKYRTIFIAFGGEETGLIGSRFYVEKNPLFPLAQTKFILNLDLMGNGDEGIVAVGGAENKTFFEELKRINEILKAVPIVRARSNAPNSDHFFFLERGIPGFFVYTLGGPPHYHDVNDTAANLRFSRFTEVRELLMTFLSHI
ncbi:MAG: M28 family peptidase [Bacteroidota bacterium]